MFRRLAGLHGSNTNVLGIPHRIKKESHHLRACRVMREISNICGTDKPHLLRATKLRKHIATRNATLKLTGLEVAYFADFLWHKEDIHKKLYTQSLPQTEEVKGPPNDIEDNEELEGRK